MWIVSLMRFLANALGHDPDAPRESSPESAAAPVPEPPVSVAEQPPFVVYGAYHPRDRGMAHGAEHWVTTKPLAIGQLRRRPGDALCKPARKFWGLYAHPEREPTCKRCIEIATRLRLVPAKESAS